VIGIGEQFGRAECWQCEASLSFAERPSDASVIDPALQLQTALVSAVRDQPSALPSIDSAKSSLVSWFRTESCAFNLVVHYS
jgi:hypothetical protein